MATPTCPVAGPGVIMPDGCKPMSTSGKDGGGFVFSPTLSGDGSLKYGESINGSAGKITIDGDRNKFI